MKTFRYLVTVVVLLTLAACGQIQAPSEESLQTAGAYGNITGTAFSGGTTTKVAGAYIFLYRYDGGRWVSLGQKATTDSYGNYTIRNAATGYSYYVIATKTYNVCLAANYIDKLQGQSPSRYHTSATTLWVRLYFSQRFSY